MRQSKSWGMNMDTNKLIGKLEDFFDLSKNKQKDKHDKLLRIIEKLETKKVKLEIEVMEESKKDETSNRYLDLSKELKVLSELVKKAKKKALSD
jgi:7-keto-8-aminopelargonate synthetase-like enzyme